MLSETRRVYGSGALEFFARGGRGGEVVHKLGDEVRVPDQKDQVHDGENNADNAGNDAGGGHSVTLLPAIRTGNGLPPRKAKAKCGWSKNDAEKASASNGKNPAHH